MIGLLASVVLLVQVERMDCPSLTTFTTSDATTTLHWNLTDYVPPANQAYTLPASVLCPMKTEVEARIFDSRAEAEAEVKKLWGRNDPSAPQWAANGKPLALYDLDRCAPATTFIKHEEKHEKKQKVVVEEWTEEWWEAAKP